MNLYIYQLYDPEIPFLGICIQEESLYVTTENLWRTFLATLFIISLNRKQSKCPPIGEWINNLWCICSKGYYSTLKKKTEQ